MYLYIACLMFEFFTSQISILWFKASKVKQHCGIPTLWAISQLVANIKADVYHCPQLSVRSAKLFDCFFGVSSTVITSTGTIGGGASIASASNVLDQGGLIRQPFALYWHFGLVSFEHNYYHPLYAIAIACFTITSVPCAPFMAVRHTAKNISSKNNNIEEK